MPGLLVQVGATVTCAHGGQASAAVPNPRVTLGGAPSVTLASPWLVAACAFPPPPAANGPCVTGQFLTGTVRVLANGQPLVVAGGASLCAPTGTPLVVAAPQVRVVAS